MTEVRLYPPPEVTISVHFVCVCGLPFRSFAAFADHIRRAHGRRRQPQPQPVGASHEPVR